jgi:hypothetical protein
LRFGSTATCERRSPQRCTGHACSCRCAAPRVRQILIRHHVFGRGFSRFLARACGALRKCREFTRACDDSNTLHDIELWRRKQQFERRHPRPDYPAEVLEGFALDWATLGQRESLERLVIDASMDDDRAKSLDDCVHGNAAIIAAVKPHKQKESLTNGLLSCGPCPHQAAAPHQRLTGCNFVPIAPD